MNGAAVLLALRETNSWKGLCDAYGVNPNANDSFVFWLSSKLGELRSLGLVEFEGDAGRPETITAPIRVQDHWSKVQMALGGPKLKDIAELADPGALAVRPAFPLQGTAVQLVQVFVVMPFAEAMKLIYDDHIKKSARSLGLTVARADDFFTTHALINDIWAAILAAEIVIADCTGRNPNVFYEIGMAHVLGKKVVLITQSKEDVPVDVGHIRYIVYSNTPRGMGEFETRLEQTLRNELGLNATASAQI
jgi:hypothetical protein